MKKSLFAPILFFAGSLLGQPQDGYPDEKVYTVVEETAYLPGGDLALHDFTVARLKVPDEMAFSGLEGTIYVSLIVNKDGSVSEPAIMKSLTPACDAAVIDMVKKLPAFTPARQGGKPVRFRLIFPIKIARPVLRLPSAGLPLGEKAATPKKAATVIVDRPPQYMAGEEAIYKLISASIKTPADVTPDRAGHVHVSFIVGKDGVAKHFTVENHRFGDNVSAEALRVAKLLTGWRPAMHKGQAIEHKVVLPIWFPYNQ